MSVACTTTEEGSEDIWVCTAPGAVLMSKGHTELALLCTSHHMLVPAETWAWQSQPWQYGCWRADFAPCQGRTGFLPLEEPGTMAWVQESLLCSPCWGYTGELAPMAWAWESWHYLGLPDVLRRVGLIPCLDRARELALVVWELESWPHLYPGPVIQGSLPHHLLVDVYRRGCLTLCQDSKGKINKFIFHLQK